MSYIFLRRIDLRLSSSYILLFFLRENRNLDSNCKSPFIAFVQFMSLIISALLIFYQFIRNYITLDHQLTSLCSFLLSSQITVQILRSSLISKRTLGLIIFLFMSLMIILNEGCAYEKSKKYFYRSFPNSFSYFLFHFCLILLSKASF